MQAERRLATVGFSLSDAIAFCQSMRRDGEPLERIIAELERRSRARQEADSGIEGLD